MGGAGVAVADAAIAPLFNPALLSVTRYSDDFSLILPAVGVHVADTEDFYNRVDGFQSGGYLNELQSAVDTLNTALAGVDLGTIQTSAANVSTSLNNISVQLSGLSNKPVTLGGGLSTVVGIPNKKFGAAFYANVTIATGAAFQYHDAATISGLSSQASCIALAADVATANACGTLNFSTNNLESELNFRGVRLAEAGFAFSREYRINKQRISLGITPKIIQAQLYEVPINVNSSNMNVNTGADYQAQYSIPNFDLGVAQNYRNGWRSGLMIKNVIPYILYFKNAPTPGATPVATGNSLRLIPQTRIGVSHTNRWSTVALDFDLYRNDPVGLENYTQYLSMGGELNAWNWAQLRAGYRFDLVNSKRNIASIGLGFSPFGLHADLTVAGNASELGASFQLGLRF